MEHFRSTLATTAAAVLGLVVAAQIVNPHDPSLEIVRPRPVIATADATGGATGGAVWTDPPAQAALVSSAQAAEPAVDATPRAPALTMMPWPAFGTPAGEVASRAERTRKVERSRRHREARAETRRLAPAPSEAAPAPQETAARTVAQDTSGRDPIGALLKGLGIGRDREG